MLAAHKWQDITRLARCMATWTAEVMSTTLKLRRYLPVTLCLGKCSLLGLFDYMGAESALLLCTDRAGRRCGCRGSSLQLWMASRSPFVSGWVPPLISCQAAFPRVKLMHHLYSAVLDVRVWNWMDIIEDSHHCPAPKKDGVRWQSHAFSAMRASDPAVQIMPFLSASLALLLRKGCSR